MIWPQSLRVLNQRQGKYMVSDEPTALTRAKGALYAGQGAGSGELALGLGNRKQGDEGRKGTTGTRDLATQSQKDPKSSRKMA